MLGKKYCFENILFYDTASITHRLEQMAQKGWMIEKIKGNLYKYKKAEPKKVKFAVAYFPKVTSYEIYPTEKQRNYLDWCEQMGWQTVVLNKQLRILMNEDVNAVQIETDQITQLDNIHATARETFVFPKIIPIISMLMVFTSCVLRFISDPLNFITDSISIPLMFSASFSAVKDTVYILKYVHWHRESVQMAEILPVKQNKKRRLAGTLLGVALIGWTLYGVLAAEYRKLFLCFIVVLIIAGFISEFVKKDQIEMDRKPGDVRFASLLAGIVVFVIGYYGIVTMDTSVSAHMTDKQKLYVEQMYGDMDISAFVRDIWYPADYDEVDGEMKNIFLLEMEDYNPFVEERGEFFYRKFDFGIVDYTDVRQQTGSYILQYSIYYPQKPFYQLVLYAVKRTEVPNAVYINKYPQTDCSFEETDAIRWNAYKAYQLFDYQGYKTGKFIICDKDRIIKLRLESPNILTDETMAIIADKLKVG